MTARLGSRSRWRSSSVSSSIRSSSFRACSSGIDRPFGRTSTAATIAKPTSAATKTRPTTSQSIEAGSMVGTRPVASGLVGVGPVCPSAPLLLPLPGSSFRATASKAMITVRKITPANTLPCHRRCFGSSPVSVSPVISGEATRSAAIHTAPSTKRRVARGSARSRPAPPVAGPPAEAASATTASRASTARTAPPARTGSNPGSLEGAATVLIRRLTEDLCRFGLGRESGAIDVAEILAVHLQRQRPVRAQLDRVHVVKVEDAARLRRPAGHRDGDEARDRERADRAGPDEVQALLPSRLRRGTHRQPAEVRVRVAVRDERERGPAVPVHLDLGRQPSAPFGQDPGGRRQERAVGRPAAAFTPELVHAAHDLRREPESGCEPEAAAVHAPERDLARAVDADRVGDPPGSVLHIARKAQRTRQDAGAAAGDETEREAG